jgi:hypothetical protein
MVRLNSALSNVSAFPKALLVFGKALTIRSPALGQTIGSAGLPEQTQPAPCNPQRGGSWPPRPSIAFRIRSAWPLWRAYSSIMWLNPFALRYRD